MQMRCSGEVCLPPVSVQRINSARCPIQALESKGQGARKKSRGKGSEMWPKGQAHVMTSNEAENTHESATSAVLRPSPFTDLLQSPGNTTSSLLFLWPRGRSLIPAGANLWATSVYPLLLSHSPHIQVTHLLRVCCCSVAKSCLTLYDPKDCSAPGFPALHCLLWFVGDSFKLNWSLFKHMSIELVMPCNNFILCHPLISYIRSPPFEILSVTPGFLTASPCLLT